MIQVAQVALVIYGVLLIVGGVMGKVKGNSSASLVAGGLTGVAALSGFWQSLSDPLLGFMVGAMVGLLLTGIFVSRFARSRQFMPAGLILLMSLIVGLLCMLARQEVEASLNAPEVRVTKKAESNPVRFRPHFERSVT
ncbi:MAG: TMEM14 family protein [Candidatus Latescibacteria bacterium]|jgi:uncharacterized membrane protein (UPF0136 family)|nr:TMEM14 family protein [Candidatus Latescibacterota bacterium]MBT4139603.1 TMEM14 family protein [Candidatus Latescibacterota bacterium]MBT5828571.1 TMEM14 family protein [Candidatus Latescibacterota bacterium]